MESYLVEISLCMNTIYTVKTRQTKHSAQIVSDPKVVFFKLKLEIFSSEIKIYIQNLLIVYRISLNSGTKWYKIWIPRPI